MTADAVHFKWYRTIKIDRINIIKAQPNSNKIQLYCWILLKICKLTHHYLISIRGSQRVEGSNSSTSYSPIGGVVVSSGGAASMLRSIAIA